MNGSSSSQLHFAETARADRRRQRAKPHGAAAATATTGSPYRRSDWEVASGLPGSVAAVVSPLRRRPRQAVGPARLCLAESSDGLRPPPTGSSDQSHSHLSARDHAVTRAYVQRARLGGGRYRRLIGPASVRSPLRAVSLELGKVYGWLGARGERLPEPRSKETIIKENH